MYLNILVSVHIFKDKISRQAYRWTIL